MASQTELRQRITNQIIDALKSGNLPPWRKPWASHRNAGFPTNVVSKRSYSGINPMLLLLSAEKHNFRTKWWGTYRQWEQLGGNVMRRPEHVEPGHWGTAVILWKPVEKTEVDPDTGEESTKILRLPETVSPLQFGSGRRRMFGSPACYRYRGRERIRRL